MKKSNDIRDIFFENIKKNFIKDKNFYILTNDADVHALRGLRNEKRFLDTGVAEQNLINIASGLAKCNKNPIVYGFCTFLTLCEAMNRMLHPRVSSLWMLCSVFDLAFCLPHIEVSIIILSLCYAIIQA